MLRVRIDRELRAGLARLRRERHINVSAWVRHRLRTGLEEELGPGFGDVPTVPAPAVAVPIPGWKPARLGDDSWGSSWRGDAASLPEDLEGQVIEVTARSGSSWSTTVTEVLERSEKFVLVRDSGKPAPPK